MAAPDIGTDARADLNEPDSGDLDDGLSDIFEADDDGVDDQDDFVAGAPADLKRYNQQHQGRDASEPHGNSQKPVANTRARIDDQIAELSKHAAKIRLDNVKQDQAREKDKADRATAELVLDQRTRFILLMTINRGLISEVHGAISTGKEANVYGAVLHPDDGGPPIQRAIKIYKTSILVFKDRERYIKGEHRFKAGANRHNNRKMVELWAQKEFRNLRRLHANGIPCPEPIMLKLHVMVMGFLGDKRGYAYPRLHDVRLAGDDVDKQWAGLYARLLGIMRRLYRVCNLVHADLSEYNVLYHDHELYVIDVSQSVEHDHPMALEFLRMDIKNVGDFFRRQGVDTLGDRAVFDFITAPDGPVDEPGMSQALQRLYENRPAVEDEAALEVETEVFRNQYIPQTLDEVYDIEKERDRPVDEMVYKHMLADHVVESLKKDDRPEDQADTSEDGESDEDATPNSDESDSGTDEGQFERPRPRGKKHQDKEEKRLHKQAVKEEKREKRKDKIPKAVKKRIVATTKRTRKSNK